jgi:hypothetical protein
MFRGVPGRPGAKTPADTGRRGAIIVLGMSPLGVILLVVGILAAVLLMLVPILGWARRRSQRIEAELAAELAGEPPLIGPEKAMYRGGSGPYPKVKGNGVIVLTDRRLILRMVVGKDVEVPRDEITGARETKRFRGAVVGGYTHLVVATASGELGFFVADSAAWLAALDRAVPA